MDNQFYLVKDPSIEDYILYVVCAVTIQDSLGLRGFFLNVKLDVKYPVSVHGPNT